jgi:large subunit ribosomal protein L24
MQKFKTGDNVIVISGRDKGKTGKISSFSKKDRVFVSGINLVKKHVKANPQNGVSGGITPIEASIHRSNIALVNPATGKADKVGVRKDDSGKNVRFFKSNNELVD